MIYLEELKRIIKGNKFETLDKSLLALEDIIKTPQIIDIAILGQFKAGKSSFINNLFGISVMPVGVTPVTSVITRLQYGEKEKVRVSFLNGEEIKVYVNEIENYICEKHNPENIKQVYVVDIELPQLAEYKNIRIIDTPGIGSIFKHNTETTENWLTKIGIAIITISAERPLAENDILLVKEIQKHCPQTLILLTKIDLFTQKQIEEITSYLEDALKKNLQKEMQIMGYTIKDNGIYREHILKQIIEPIVKNSGAHYEQIVNHKLNSLAESCKALLEIALQAANNSEAENTRLKKIILDEQTNFQYIFTELQLISRSKKETTRETVYNILEKHKIQIIAKLTNEFNNVYNQWNGNLDKTARHYESWIKDELTKELKQIMLTDYSEFSELSEKAKNHFEFYIQSFSERLNKNIKKALGLKVPQKEWQIEIKKLKEPDVSISWAFDYHLDSLWFIFPMAIFRNIFMHYFINQIPYEVKKNIHRLTSDLSVMINDSIDNYKEQSLKFITSELNTINTILTNQKAESETIKRQILAISDIII